LREGNRRFVEGRLIHGAQDPEARAALVKGQHPPAIILSCSDSRVPPEIVFDQGLGQVFTVRNAGQVPNSDSIASIEYALDHLGSRLLVVMGHESCGAVKAAATTPVGKTAGSPQLDRLLSEIRPNIAHDHLSGTGDPTYRPAVKDHVSAVMVALVKRSKIIRSLVHSGRLVLAQGVYSLKTGSVEFWAVGEKYASIRRSY
jgi:carbonic anhydrase